MKCLKLKGCEEPTNADTVSKHIMNTFINCFILFVQKSSILIYVYVCVCLNRMVDANRRKRRRDAEKDCCVGEVLTCLFGSCVSSTNHIILANHVQFKHV